MDNKFWDSVLDGNPRLDTSNSCSRYLAQETRNYVKALSSLPTDDGNFKSALSNAGDTQIRLAIQEMETNGRQNKTRIKACERELVRRASKRKE